MGTRCGTCKGNGHVTIRMPDLSGRRLNLDISGTYILGIVACPGCQGKGFVNDHDRQRVQSVEMYNQIVR